MDAKTAEKIVNEYRRVIKKKASMTFGSPDSFLPYKKEEIKEAIKLSLSLSGTDIQKRIYLVGSYLTLAKFIPGEEAEIAAKAQAALMSGDVDHRDWRYVEEAVKISERICEEEKALLKEVKNFRIYKAKPPVRVRRKVKG